MLNVPVVLVPGLSPNTMAIVVHRFELNGHYVILQFADNHCELYTATSDWVPLRSISANLTEFIRTSSKVVHDLITANEWLRNNQVRAPSE